MLTMTVPLIENDGSQTMIEVPCTRREIKSRQINPPGRSQWALEPLPHQDFEFRRVVGVRGGFVAERKAL